MLGVLQTISAQQTDTSQTREELELQEKKVSQPYHSERSSGNYILSKSGTYGVPEPTEYYTPPFKGQESLDKAVEAYHEELDNSVANTAFFQLLGKIAPFIMNRFEFGFYQIYDMPIVERDHPLRDPQVDRQKEDK